MSVLTSLVTAAETHTELPFPAPLFGAIALVIFIALGLVMWSYRDVANRHPRKSAAFANTHDTTAHGHADRTGADH
jgi:hypothetical protein